ISKGVMRWACPTVSVQGRSQRSVWKIVAGATASGVAAYACLMKAMRTGEVATVTPFRYTRLLFGLSLGVLAFGGAAKAVGQELKRKGGGL
ncbi:MAG: hypothetical protein EBS01_15035, partial [Verrucomicrobia bacterium]|nr:hypothetical protein [Verrucomicrobiota bacterium]